MNKEKIKSAIENTIRYMNGNYYSKFEEKMIVGYLEGALKELEGQNMDSNYDVIQGDCPNCPFADLFGGFCFYYRFYPANIGYGEATCRCEELKSRED